MDLAKLVSHTNHRLPLLCGDSKNQTRWNGHIKPSHPGLLPARPKFCTTHVRDPLRFSQRGGHSLLDLAELVGHAGHRLPVELRHAQRLEKRGGGGNDGVLELIVLPLGCLDECGGLPNALQPRISAISNEIRFNRNNDSDETLFDSNNDPSQRASAQACPHASTCQIRADDL